MFTTVLCFIKTLLHVCKRQELPQNNLFTFQNLVFVSVNWPVPPKWKVVLWFELTGQNVETLFHHDSHKYHYDHDCHKVTSLQRTVFILLHTSKNNAVCLDEWEILICCERQTVKRSEHNVLKKTKTKKLFLFENWVKANEKKCNLLLQCKISTPPCWPPRPTLTHLTRTRSSHIRVC